MLSETDLDIESAYSGFGESSEKMEIIYQLILMEEYEEAAVEIASLSAEESQRPILLFYKALLSYESGSDLECLRLLAEFLKSKPECEKREYSLFTASICLVNLGMEEDALKILKTLPPGYPGLKEELSRTSLAIGRKFKAREHLKPVSEMVC